MSRCAMKSASNVPVTRQLIVISAANLYDKSSVGHLSGGSGPTASIAYYLHGGSGDARHSMGLSLTLCRR